MKDPRAGDAGTLAGRAHGGASQHSVGRTQSDRRSSSGRASDAGSPDPESALRTELLIAERRAAFLAEASSILVATSADFAGTLEALARLGVSRLADWCAIHTVDSFGTLSLAVITHSDPHLEPQLKHLVQGALTDRWRQAIRDVANKRKSQLIVHLEPAAWFDGDVADADILERSARGSAMITPLSGRGTVLGAVTLVTTTPGREFDFDELNLAEELGRRAAIALDNARLYRQADEANRAKRDFLAVMSHELRTPLNAIMGYTDLLDEGISGDMNDTQRHQLDRIRTSARHLLQLIEEILSFARMEAGAVEVQLEATTAGAIASTAAADIRGLVEAAGLSFNVEIGDSDVPLRTDPAKACQILMNLLSNAVKFTPAGTVTLRLRADDSHAHFDVIDTGIGIPAEQLDRIFDPFRQLERPDTRSVGGTGLGLSVSRRYVRLLGGEIDLKSTVGSGTHVTISLPMGAEGLRG
jgi:signal transduction histidine kinase